MSTTAKDKIEADQRKARTAAAWAKHDVALAAWVLKHLVNRDDAHGKYLPKAERKPKDKARTMKVGVTAASLQMHFRGKDGECRGLHSTGPDHTSRWLAIDVDLHEGKGDPFANERFAKAVHQKLIGLGFRPLLFDSSGGGGYHIWILFDAPIPSADAYRFGQWLVRDWKSFGLASQPETFPKQRDVKGGKGFGNWLRLPGLHHTLDHWTEAWEPALYGWISGELVVKRIVATTPSPASLIPPEALATDEEPEPKARPAKRQKLSGDLSRDSRLAEEALGHLGSSFLDDYHQWLHVGFALYGLGSVGLSLWESWSAQNPTKYDSSSCREKWGTMTDEGITLGSLFKWARDAGWPGPGKATNGRHKGNGKPEPEIYRDNITVDKEPTAASRVEILITTEEHDVIDEAVAALENAPDVFQRGNLLVGVLRDKRESRTVLRPPGSPRIEIIPPPRLRDLLTRHAALTKRIKVKEDEYKTVAAHPPEWLVPGVASRGEWPGIRHIEAVIECPAIRHDGTVLDHPGWDSATGLLYEPNAAFPKIPKAPSKDEAAAAADLLLALVVDFPFVGLEHRAAWLAALLTPIARFAIAGPCPLFLADASAPGSGKGLAFDLISILATGRNMPVTTYPDGDEEMRKRITAVALAGDRLMMIDNIATTFGGSSLDGALTATTWQDRHLGLSKMTPELPLFTVWFATGNNVQFRGDAVRRIVPIRLEPAQERPEERTDFTIKEPLRDYARRERPRLVAAALTILRAYFAAGRPDAGLVRYGSFEAWSDVVRNAVHWLLDVDPIAARKDLAANDPEEQARAELIEGWAELPGTDRGLTVPEALKVLGENPDRFATLRDTLKGFSRSGDMPSSRVIGVRLATVKGRVVNGKALRPIPLRAGAQAWKIVLYTGETGDTGDTLSPPTRGKSLSPY